MRVALKWILAAAICLSAYQSWLLRELERPPGVLVLDEPVQMKLEGPLKTLRKDEYVMEALASYQIRGRLLHRERYRWDASAGVSPLDFGLGWGPMSDTQVLEQIEFSQSGRYLSWRWRHQEPLPFDVLSSHASNNHLIPANDQVLAALNRMRIGQVVELDGYLVKVAGPRGFTWAGSLVRTDTGEGACEIMYVENAKVI
jgi:hypothetical protein